MKDIKLYKELVSFCSIHKDKIETKFDRKVEFTNFHESCFQEMYARIKNEPNPLAPKILKERVDGLTECYKNKVSPFMFRRNKMIKGLDIQLGHWYEKAFQLFLESKGIELAKKGFPYPDFVVTPENPKAYYELKYIEAPFISANNLVKNTYPYTSTRYDYECSLTLDTGKKLQGQRDMNAEDVFDYWDNVGTLHSRKEREGDKISKQIKGKIYPPLLKMSSLSSFINQIS